MTVYSDNQKVALRKLYNKTLWSYIGVAALSVAATAFLIVGNVVHSDQALYWVAVAWIGLGWRRWSFSSSAPYTKRAKKAYCFCPPL